MPKIFKFCSLHTSIKKYFLKIYISIYEKKSFLLVYKFYMVTGLLLPMDVVKHLLKIRKRPDHDVLGRNSL